MSLERYLIDVGIRASDYNHIITEEERASLLDNVDYFKQCYKDRLSSYKALLFLDDYLKGHLVINKEK